jgi:uncharacterized protein YqgC (DUF456 family)
MEQNIITIISLIIIAIGILGTFLPVLPGLAVSFVGLILYKYGANPDFSIWYIVIFGILTLISLVLNYIIPIKTTEKYGGSNYGKYGGFIGTIVGLFFPPLGFLIGMLLGVFLGELLHDRNDKQKALKATKGAFIGFIYGTGFNLMVGLAMFLVVLINIFNS